MDGVRAPKVLEVHSGNIAESWRRFKQNYEIFMKATGKNKDPKMSNEVKAALLLNYYY